MLARELISALPEFEITALKVTSIDGDTDVCPRGGEGCGACSLGGEAYALYEEHNFSEKDTGRLLAAGAARVFWLRSLRSELENSFSYALSLFSPRSVIICESNSLREIVKPALFVMLMNGKSIKSQAARFAALAEITLEFPWSETSAGILRDRARQLLKTNTAP